MTTDINKEQQPSAAALVGGIVHDVQNLLTQQMELLRQEVNMEVHKAKVGLQVAAVGAALGVAASVVLGMALALGLQTAAPQLALWACFAVSGCFILAIAAGLYAAGWVQLHGVNPLPEQTAEGLKENLQWKTNRN